MAVVCNHDDASIHINARGFKRSTACKCNIVITPRLRRGRVIGPVCVCVRVCVCLSVTKNVENLQKSHLGKKMA